MPRSPQALNLAATSARLVARLLAIVSTASAVLLGCAEGATRPDDGFGGTADADTGDDDDWGSLTSDDADADADSDADADADAEDTSDDTATDGDVDGDDGPPPDPIAAVDHLGPGIAVGPGGDGNLRLGAVHFGARAMTSSTWLVGSSLRARMGLVRMGEDASLWLDVRDLLGKGVTDDVSVDVTILGNASGSEVLGSAAGTVSLAHGRGALVGGDALSLAAETRDHLWLQLAIDGQAMAGTVRVSAPPRASWAEWAPAKGVRATPHGGVPLAAREPEIWTRSQRVLASAGVANLPSASQWDCHHDLEVLGTPSVRLELNEEWVPSEFAGGVDVFSPVVVPYWTTATARLVPACQNCAGYQVELTLRDYRPTLSFAGPQPSGFMTGPTDLHYNELALDNTQIVVGSSDYVVEIHSICTRK